jgi:ABC-type phosphate transport system substrate-binding protein
LRLLPLLLFTIILASLGLAQTGDLAIIVSKDVPIDDLSFPEIRKLFRGERQFWTLNHRVTLLVRAPVAHERDVVLRRIYVMTEAQYRQYWISKVFRADVASGPKLVYSDSMTTELVAAIPGSVGFIEAAKVPQGFKVLKVDGLKPGDKGYPLR